MEKNECKGLCVTNRSVSLAVAGALLCLVSVFLAGFFVGQRSAAQQFIGRVEQDAFADHIYAAMCGLSETAEGEEGAPDDGETESGDGEEQAQAVTGSEGSSGDVKAAEEAREEIEENEGASECYAELIGFGTAKAAQDYANRLKKKGVPVFVQKRHSRSAKGRLVTWYQVVTEKFRDEEKLKALIARLKKEEKLQGIRVVAC